MKYQEIYEMTEFYPVIANDFDYAEFKRLYKKEYQGDLEYVCYYGKDKKAAFRTFVYNEIQDITEDDDPRLTEDGAYDMDYLYDRFTNTVQELNGHYFEDMN